MEIDHFAPIALFAYNRPSHLVRTINALAKNEMADKSELHIFCDGPKNDSDSKLVKEVIEIASHAEGFKKLHIHSTVTNKGLANSIIEGVSKLNLDYGKVIVLEDDMVTSKFFLKYMNESLELFKDQEKIISIHGYVYPLKTKMNDPFFLRGADCWGWATWQRAWEIFDPDANKLLSELKKLNLMERFNFDGTYEFSKMLEDFIQSKNNSWAIRWYASALLADKLTLYPNISLVQNIGNDDSGTNCSTDSGYEVILANSPIRINHLNVTENLVAYNEFKSFFKSQKSLGYKMKRLLKKIL